MVDFMQHRFRSYGFSGLWGFTKYDIQIEGIGFETFFFGIKKKGIGIGINPLSIGILVSVLVLALQYLA